MMNFSKGLQEIGKNTYAYLQPDGSWGWSNSGLIVSGEESLLVDTLFDEPLTAQMLQVMKDATGIGGSEITTLVNTHANGDHCYGNHLCHNAEIIASESAAREINEMPPEILADIIRNAPALGDVGEYIKRCFGAFDIAGVTLTPPTKTFCGQMDVAVGDKTVQLIEVGPAHTQGDVLAYCPEDKTIFTGDILFINGTPIMWAGPVANWLAACDRIMAMDVDVIVPGHGPITDKAGVQKVRNYLQYVDQEVRKRYDAGLSVEEAAFDIALGDFDSWLDAERIAVNVDTLYREYSGSKQEPDIVELFVLMAKVDKARRG
jgi:cyclase